MLSMNIKAISQKILSIIPLRKKTVPQQPFVYCALGDSTVEGFGASSKEKAFPALINQVLKQHFKNTDFYNLGVGGAVVKDVLNSQLKQTIELQPNLVTISIGANNVMRGTRESEFRKQMRALLEELTSNTQAKVVINNIPDFLATSFVPKPIQMVCNFRAKRFNKIIEEESLRLKVTHVDLYTLSKVFAHKNPVFVSQDGFHPSDAGYAMWANTIISYIYQLLFLSDKKMTFKF